MGPASASARTAAPETVTCGEVITHSIVLANDLSCSFGQTVLTVGADHITINLAGHTLQGIFGPALSSAGRRYVTIENGSLGDNAIALRVTGDRHDTVRNLVAAGGGEGSGASFSGGSYNRVLDSTLLSGPGFAPLELENESEDVVAGNTAISQQGLKIGPGGGARVVRNTTSTVDVTGSGNLIEANVMTPVPPAVAGLVIEGDQNRVIRNHVSSGLAGGQVVQFLEGISVTGSDNALGANTAVDSAGDGIHILTADNRVTANVANDNGAFGIEAVPGVIDGGRNRASGNGTPAQCLNIDCSASEW